jgi:hypothetical protein
MRNQFITWTLNAFRTAFSFSCNAVLYTATGGSSSASYEAERVVGVQWLYGMDVGLYYSEAEPFSIAAIQHIANALSVDATPTVTGFYKWGAWVNGGAWIQTLHGKVDFLYRNVDQIRRAITDAQHGIAHHDYSQQPPYGFYSVIYLAETHICIPLYDPATLITELKRSIASYPPKLQQSIIQNALWSAEFSLHHARDFAVQGDVSNTVGCLTRVVSNLTQVLFAVNERYFLRDKKVFDEIATFVQLPTGYIQHINRILACPGNTVQELTQTVTYLEQVWRSIVSLPGVQYAPKFRLGSSSLHVSAQ